MSTNGDSQLDKINPELVIEFGEPKERHVVKFTLNSFMKIEKLTGKNMLTGELFTDTSATTMAILLWAGLLHEKNNMTVDELAEKMTLEDLKQLPSLIQRAFANASPSNDEKKTSLDAPKELTVDPMTLTE